MVYTVFIVCLLGQVRKRLCMTTLPTFHSSSSLRLILLSEGLLLYLNISITVRVSDMDDMLLALVLWSDRNLYDSLNVLRWHF